MSDLILFSSAAGVALLGSGHCFGMCGAIASLPGRRATPLYQLGRLVGYGALGALSGMFGKSFFALFGSRPEFQVFAILIMAVVMAFQWIPSIQESFESSWVTRFYRKVYGVGFAPLSRQLMQFSNGFPLGLSNSLIPCGFIFYFGSIAAATGSPLRGVILFAGLWAGSLPVLLAAAVGSAVLKKRLSTPRRRFLFQAALLLVGIYSLGFRLEGGHLAHFSNSNPALPNLVCGK